MAERTDAFQLRACGVFEFATARIALHMLSVEIAAHAHVCEVGSMRPDGVGRGAIALGIAGIDDIDEIYLAIIVVVVLREVYPKAVVCQLTGIADHLSGVAVVAL